MKSIVILISGRGSNMRSLLDAVAAGTLPVRVAAVLSNRGDAPGLATAAARGVATHIVDHRAFASREAFDAALAGVIDSLAPDLVLLAGFMRILSDGFVQHFAGRLINIHPSLLPAFPGLHTHRRALAEGVRVHGCTVHFVTPTLDHGPIIVQAAVPVLDGDDEASLAARVLAQEHRVYPLAVRWLAEERLHMVGGRVLCSAPQDGATALISPPA
ncbi:MAG: phosphoribosylglycinamide formyltransferase [Propionivibrio sp.]|uniref:phosphoribosylglycinamide formyltransferase n=1 Tax=Propionivibrio sp. TaxID=2212460 RepID=UPI001A3920BC|nr:phosphoribosylglycinamide formyltransferase [Propionivibrio sp.]MBL8412853.1 phosphoribosylglycinamide formyltransferase [Propionivibrio sp.]